MISTKIIREPEMIKLYLFAALLLLVGSCAKSDRKLATYYYVSHSPTFAEKVNNTLRHGRWSWTLGTELTLNRDSTFVMTTCANHITGDWYANADTLFLRYRDVCYVIDSLNYSKEGQEKPSICGKIVYLLRNRQYLERASVDSDNRYVITRLVESQ
jgi:hypothetical protein